MAKKKTIVRQKIKCSPRTVDKVAQELGVSNTLVYAAMNFFNNNDKAQEIRKRVLAVDGALVEEEVVIC